MEGIIIYSLSYKEKSKIVYVYTEMGMKGILVNRLKENIIFTTTLNIVNFETTNKALPTLISCDLIQSFYDFNEKLDKIANLMTMLQIIKALEPDAPHKRIYPFFKKCLSLLYEKDNSNYPLALFLTKMLAVFGVRPIFDSCVKCGNTKGLVHFSVLDGGSLCYNCALSNEPILSIIKQLYYDNLYDEQLYFKEDKLILKTLKEYYLIHAHVHLKNT